MPAKKRLVQPSIFSFSRKKETFSIDLTKDSYEVIEGNEIQEDEKIIKDVVVDVDNVEYTEEPPNSIYSVEDPIEELAISPLNTISCPICLLDISNLTLDDRNVHVDDCMNFNVLEDATAQESETSSVATSSSIKPVTKKPRKKRVKDEDDDVQKVSKKSTITKKPPRILPSLPAIKKLRFPDGTQIIVDGFNFQPELEIPMYFLSHFHADHYIGLTKSWSYRNSNKLIYCSEITGKLLLLKFNVLPNIVKMLPMETKISIGDNIWVTLIDANHCPGAAIMLFEYETPEKVHRILHCGDFRINHPMLIHSLLQKKIHQCYLDTTYLNPVYNFPKQEVVVNTSSEFVEKLVSNEFNTSKQQSSVLDFFKSATSLLKYPKKNYLIVIGSYTIGKERLAISIAEKIKSKLYASHDKRAILNTFESDVINSLLTDDPYSCQVHIVPMKYISSSESLYDYFKTYQTHFQKIIGFRPTGWTFNRVVSTKDLIKGDNNLAILEKGLNTHSYFKVSDIWKQYNENKVVQIYQVPYSEHSSFRELSFFCILMDFDEILPTVNQENWRQVQEMDAWIQSWKQYKSRNELTIKDF